MYWEATGRGADRVGWAVDEVDSSVARALGGWAPLEASAAESGSKGAGGYKEVRCSEGDAASKQLTTGLLPTK